MFDDGTRDDDNAVPCGTESAGQLKTIPKGSQRRVEPADFFQRIGAQDHAEVMAYLRARELSTDAYREAILPLRLDDGRRIEALAYVMRRDHWQYVGGLALSEQARIIARACGGRGPNCDYLFNTARHLAEIGLADAELDRLSADVRRLMAE